MEQLKLSDNDIELIAKSLGWRLEFLKESEPTAFHQEIEQIQTILYGFGITTVVDPDTGEVSILKPN